MTGNVLWTDRHPTDAELAAMEATQAKARREAGADLAKITGIEFDGVMCSATSQDQAGLIAVLLAIQMQGAKFKPTVFRFANGSELVISLANYQAFMAAWLPFRQSFFMPE